MLDFEDKDLTLDQEIEEKAFYLVWNKLSDSFEFVEKEYLIEINNFDFAGYHKWSVGNVQINYPFNHLLNWKDFGDLPIVIKEFVRTTYKKILEENSKGAISIILNMPQLKINCADWKYSKSEFEDTKRAFTDFLEYLSEFEKINSCFISFNHSSHTFVEINYNDEYNIHHQEFLSNNSVQLVSSESSEYGTVEAVGYTEIKDFKKLIEYSFDKVEKYGLRI